MCLQMLERCRKIAEQIRQHNPQMWDTIRCIINQLDVNGMSRDKTDTPISVHPKVMRCVALLWISSIITNLLHTVEPYTPAMNEENMSIPVGNTSLLTSWRQDAHLKNLLQLHDYLMIGITMIGTTLIQPVLKHFLTFTGTSKFCAWFVRQDICGHRCERLCNFYDCISEYTDQMRKIYCISG